MCQANGCNLASYVRGRMVDNVEGGVVESAPYVGSPYIVCRVLLVGVRYDGEAPSLRI